jgi:phage-related tail protein
VTRPKRVKLVIQAFCKTLAGVSNLSTGTNAVEAKASRVINVLFRQNPRAQVQFAGTLKTEPAAVQVRMATTGMPMATLPFR